nr:terminase large subunit [Lactococcus garvieae]
MSKQTYLKTINFPEHAKLLAAAKENKERIDSLVINNDSDKKMLKEERAKTNKFIKEFKANAKAVREKVLGEFDPKVKELSSVLEETQLLCKDKIEDYDLTWKHERENWVLEAINLRITDDISEFVDIDALDDPRYLNASMSEKKIAEDLDNKVSTIKSDLQIAQAISPQVAAIFKECLDIPEAIARDKRQQEEQAKREAIGSGVVPFDNLQVVPGSITNEMVENFDNIRPAVDFGYATDPLAYVRWHYDKKKNGIYAIDELYGQKISNRELAKWLHKKGYQSDVIFADSAEPKSIAELKSEHNIPRIKGVKKGPDSVEYGEQWLDDLDFICIDPKRTPKIAWEFENIDYQVDKDGNPKPRLEDKDNHTIDATRYAFSEDMRNVKTTIASKASFGFY